MAHWEFAVDLTDVWKANDLPYREQRDRIVKRLLDSRWMTHTGHPMTLNSLIMSLSETETYEDFNTVWNSVYDLADMERVWIATF